MQADLFADLPAAPAALDSHPELLAQLDRWVERGWLRALDRALAAFFLELEPGCPPLALLAAVLASHQLGHGHVCLDLRHTLDKPDFALSLPPEGDEARDGLLPSQLLASVQLDDWQAALRSSTLVAVDGEPAERPLVLSGELLYLRRYWNHEQAVAAAIRRRLAQRLPEEAVDQAALAQLFPPSGALDWQQLACALALRNRFSLITGGPGTGKTTTVVRLLALLQQQALAAGQPLRIRLAAPTGKAAARLTESIGLQVKGLAVEEAVRAQIPHEVSTLHRLLGSKPDSRHFRHHAGNPLALDVLVVDEASMIDLEMMACVLDALPPHARLVLLGDKDQLASVEAGALLGDLCREAEVGHYSAGIADWLAQLAGQPLEDPALQPGDGSQPLADCTVMLRHSRRFGPESGIGQLARAVNAMDVRAARRILARGGADLHVLQLAGEQDRQLEPLLLDGLPERGQHGYQHYLQVLAARPEAALTLDDPAWDDWARRVLAAFDEFRLLCAVRKGAWGVEGLNARIASALFGRAPVPGDAGWYEGRPVLVTRNDYSLGLMNGDIGIALYLPEPEAAEGRALRVVFPRNDGSGGLRHVLPSRLGALETVFAMTVHKSQGSEFRHCALILPPTLNPVLTRELVYTGITRARECFSLIESRPAVFDEALQRKVERRSGLLAALQSGGWFAPAE